jgi:hypothetical protein
LRTPNDEADERRHHTGKDTAAITRIANGLAPAWNNTVNVSATSITEGSHHALIVGRG